LKATLHPLRHEPRWPVALAILAVILLMVLLPQAIRLLPMWVTYVLGAVVFAPVVGVGWTSAQPGWLRAERVVILLFFAVSVVLILANLANLVDAMVHRSTEITGVQLLASSIGAWTINVLVFSLLYWQMDRGGPEARVNREGRRTDWLFPQENAPAEDVPAGWGATYVDYLYLAYSTATAFSTTEVAPLTPRAKLLMMLESSISLATILLVAARAINILGS
jgi:hypothetical protein